jgi:hypothetical protein
MIGTEPHGREKQPGSMTGALGANAMVLERERNDRFHGRLRQKDGTQVEIPKGN